MRLVCLILIFFFQSTWAADATLSVGKPSDVGMDATILEAGVNMYRKAIERDEIRSVVILIVRKGRVIVHEALGWKDKERGVLLKKNAMFRMASNTKPVVATAIAILSEKGKLKFDDPVYRPSHDDSCQPSQVVYRLIDPDIIPMAYLKPSQSLLPEC